MERMAWRLGLIAISAVIGAGCPPDSAPPEPLGSGGTPSDVETVSDISDDLEAVRQGRAPALAASFVSADAQHARGATGKRKRGESDNLVNIEDSFHLGSVTKVYTALLVARLVDAGHLRWDLSLGEVFDDIHPDWASVTLLMLLRHEGGTTGAISRDFPDLWSQLYADGNSDLMATRAAFAETILTVAPSQPVGTVVYSNAGFMIVGAVIEHERGRTWEEELSSWVLEPMGAEGCGFGPPTGEAPWGHDAGGTPRDPEDATSDNPPALGPAGTLACKVDDFGRLGQIYLHAFSGDETFVSAASLTVLQTPNAAGFVPGMIRDDGQPWAGGPAYVMNGSNTLWWATIWIAPELDRSYAVVANRGTGDAAAAVNDIVIFGISEGF